VECKHNGRHKKKKDKDFSCWYFAEYSKQFKLKVEQKYVLGELQIVENTRAVELLKKARENYEKRKSENPDWTDSGHVLYQEDSGLAMLPKVIGRRYKKFMQSTDIPYRNLHVLRHTFASLLAKNGASPKDLQSLLGHSDSYTSIQIYTHSYKDVQRKNTMLLDQEILEKGSEVG
jgi:site-specific recombinase XerD